MAEGAVENQRPVMPRKLLKAAIEGNKQVVTQMLRLREDSNDETNVTIDDAWAEYDSSSSDGDQHHDYLQSATFMGNTVLHVVCSNDHDVLAYKICMIDYSLLKALNKLLETPLHCAAKAGCTRTVGALLEYAEKSVFLSSSKEIVRERNCHGETALHEAARHNHEGIVEKLMEVDLELVYELDNYGISALDIALARGTMKWLRS
ncbi:hypothetical protein LUZ60_010707 [Juncus effusus]|nr:hypothetical protein LUZ60_010707 [Juncus effusus]